MKLIKNKNDKFNELLDEVNKLKEQRAAEQNYDLLKKEYNELKYGPALQKGKTASSFFVSGLKTLGEFTKSLSKDESRLEVRRVVNPIIKQIFADLESIKLIESEDTIIIGSNEYTRLKAKYYPKE